MRGRWVLASRGLLVAVLLVAAGCGSSGTISGKVRYKGKELTSGRITFITAERGRAFPAPIGPDGSYHVQGVPVGPVKVTVQSFQEAPTPPGSQGGRPAGVPKDVELPKDMSQSSLRPTKAQSAVPEKFNDPQTSGLEYTVIDGKQEKDFDLP
jgi:hypothetical protein